MPTSLIVARMAPTSMDAVADIFTASDQSALPGLVGVTRRQLFRYQGLYFHLFETAKQGDVQVERVRDHDLFVEVNAQLSEHVTPFDPATWRSPKDAMANLFYEWNHPG